MPLRIGHGYDIHRTTSPGRLMLAGVCVSESIGVEAHSDGDVVLHAIVDAICGALGLGDIGRRFPNTDPRWKNADSSIFVSDVMKEIASRGGSVVNLDVTILAERPKLSPFREAMTNRIRELCRCDAVNVKAGTNEGVDAVGRGEAIAAHAVILIDIESNVGSKQ